MEIEFESYSLPRSSTVLPTGVRFIPLNLVLTLALFFSIPFFYFFFLVFMFSLKAFYFLFHCR